MNEETKKILNQILQNQNMLSLAIRRVLPNGNNETTPYLERIEKSNKELIKKLKWCQIMYKTY